MSQPHFPDIGIFCQMRRFIECHMLIFFGLLKLVLLSVHPLTYKEIGSRSIISDRIRRSRIRTISDLKPFPRRSKNHIWRIGTAIHVHRLTLLQHSPISLRNPCSICPVHIEPSDSVDLQRISVAQDIMIDPKCFQPVAIHLE